jgi:hypothetical protein
MKKWEVGPLRRTREGLDLTLYLNASLPKIKNQVHSFPYGNMIINQLDVMISNASPH